MLARGRSALGRRVDVQPRLYAAVSIAVRWSFARLLVLGNWLSLHAVLGRGGTGPLLESFVEISGVIIPNEVSDLAQAQIRSS
jgi:hypothetical protein